MNMKKTHRAARRGMTLIETVLAISITAMVGGAITTMMAAVTDEVTANQETRTNLIRSGLAQSRFSSYIARAHCVLDMTDTSMTLWLEDSREGGTVHASEIRWIRFDPRTGTVESSFVCFPETWSEATRLMADTEFLDVDHVDWPSVLASFETRGLICMLPMVEGVSNLNITGNATEPQDITLIETSMDLSLFNDYEQSCTAESIRVHRRPGEEG
ncbi:MAG: type II secretion system GspH family protein [Phycisphaerales bacterium]|nr:type II secretion system GspH family protein [Phycisphaerales bacterium]